MAEIFSNQGCDDRERHKKRLITTVVAILAIAAILFFIFFITIKFLILPRLTWTTYSTPEIFSGLATTTPSLQLPSVRDGGTSSKPTSDSIASSPKPIPSLPWLTYKSLDYGFEIGHPRNYQARHYTNPPLEGTGVKLEMDIISETIKYPRGIVSIFVHQGLTEEKVIEQHNVTGDIYENTIFMKYAGEATIGREKYPAKKFVAEGVLSYRTKPPRVISRGVTEGYLAEKNGYFYYFRLDTQTPEIKERSASMLATLRFIDIQPQSKPEIKITNPRPNEIWDMVQRTYTIRWDAKPVQWYDGYGVVLSGGGKAKLYLGGVDYFIGETKFEDGFFVWTIPFDLSYRFNANQVIFMEVFPPDSGFYRNPAVAQGEKFIIESSLSSFPERFIFPAGGEKITIGTPIVVEWTPLLTGPGKFGVTLEPSRDNPDADEIRKALEGNIPYMWRFEGNLTDQKGFVWDGKTIIGSVNDLYKFRPGFWRFILGDHLGHGLIGNDFELIAP